MPPSVSDVAREMVDALLVVNEAQRFGAFTTGTVEGVAKAEDDALHASELAQLKAHPFLASLDWAAIERKQCAPPFPPCDAPFGVQ